MKKTLIVLLLVFLLIENVNGQDAPLIRFHLQGYNFIFPGIELAYQQPIYRVKTNRKKTNTFVINVAPVADFYYYTNNHFGIGFTGELNTQYIFHNGIIIGAYGGFGFVNAILSGKVYELNDQGTFEEKKFVGNVYSNWKAGFGIGKEVILKSGKTLSFNLNGGVRQARTPGSFVTPNISFGVSYLINKKNDKK